MYNKAKVNRRSKIMKLALICVCNLLAMVFLAFAACASTSGTITRLEMLVSNDLIGEEQLQNIAALRNGSLQKVKDKQQGELDLETVEYTVVPVADSLTAEQETTILKDFKYFIEKRYQDVHVNYKVSESRIVKYYGAYNDYIVAEIRFAISGVIVSGDTSDLIISDYYLGKIADNSLIVAWSEKK